MEVSEGSSIGAWSSRRASKTAAHPRPFSFGFHPEPFHRLTTGGALEFRSPRRPLPGRSGRCRCRDRSGSPAGSGGRRSLSRCGRGRCCGSAPARGPGTCRGSGQGLEPASTSITWITRDSFSWTTPRSRTSSPASKTWDSSPSSSSTWRGTGAGATRRNSRSFPAAAGSGISCAATTFLWFLPKSCPDPTGTTSCPTAEAAPAWPCLSNRECWRYSRKTGGSTTQLQKKPAALDWCARLWLPSGVRDSSLEKVRRGPRLISCGKGGSIGSPRNCWEFCGRKSRGAGGNWRPRPPHPDSLSRVERGKDDLEFPNYSEIPNSLPSFPQNQRTPPINIPKFPCFSMKFPPQKKSGSCCADSSLWCQDLG